jgi:cytidylate kinase
MRVIAIDGPAGSGKSTVARAVAERLGLQYLDTGAMYRAVTFAALRRGVDLDDSERMGRLAADIELEMPADGSIVVDGFDATIEIRGPEVTRAVSIVAANAGVREEMRQRQRAWALQRDGGVMEGRDIGTVVFPEADVKVYLDASPEERARRRASDPNHSGGPVAVAEVATALSQRDEIDRTRTASPLYASAEAVVIDTTGQPVDAVVSAVMAVIRTALEAT